MAAARSRLPALRLPALLLLLSLPNARAAICENWGPERCAEMVDGSCRCALEGGRCVKSTDCGDWQGITAVDSDYAPVGGAGEVVVDEGFTVAAYKEDCPVDSHSCFRTTPDPAFCEAHCTDSAACHSFAFCAGNLEADFPRCYLKTRKVDFATKPHASGDCTTYDGHGARLGGADYLVARNEGANLASYKPDCTEEPVDFCFRTTPTFDFCNASCAGQSGCKSFAFCTGAGTDVDFTRCYLKTADFYKQAHAPGDCQTYYPAASAACRDVKGYFQAQGCCGAPHKELDMNKAKTGGVQQF